VKPPSEFHIADTCSDWLALDGWRRLNTNPVSDRSRAKGFGELGMADDLYIRYRYSVEDTDPTYAGWDRECADVMWVEWKKPGGKVSPHQKAWHLAERGRGALVVVATEDFLPSIEGFQVWYRASGLMRKRI